MSHRLLIKCKQSPFCLQLCIMNSFKIYSTDSTNKQSNSKQVVQRSYEYLIICMINKQTSCKHLKGSEH